MSLKPPANPLLALPGALLLVDIATLLALSLRALICASAASRLTGVPGVPGAGQKTSSLSLSGTIIVVV